MKAPALGGAVGVSRVELYNYERPHSALDYLAPNEYLVAREAASLRRFAYCGMQGSWHSGRRRSAACNDLDLRTQRDERALVVRQFSGPSGSGQTKGEAKLEGGDCQASPVHWATPERARLTTLQMPPRRSISGPASDSAIGPTRRGRASRTCPLRRLVVAWLDEVRICLCRTAARTKSRRDDRGLNRPSAYSRTGADACETMRTNDWQGCR